MMLTVMSIFGAVATPSVDDYLAQARLVRVNNDVRTIATSMVRLFNDVGAERRLPKGWASYDLLVGPGGLPQSADASAEEWTKADDATVGHLDHHLIHNGAGYATPAAPGLGWRGAYLQQPVSTDPWGARFAVNVRAMHTPYADTVVLSAGPNGVIESPFERDGLPTSGDDVVGLIASSGLAR